MSQRYVGVCETLLHESAHLCQDLSTSLFLAAARVGAAEQSVVCGFYLGL